MASGNGKTEPGDFSPGSICECQLRLVVADADTKDRRRQVNTRLFDLVNELRAQAGRAQAANDFARLNAGLFKLEDVGHGDDIAFHALDFGDLRNLTAAVA